MLRPGLHIVVSAVLKLRCQEKLTHFDSLVLPMMGAESVPEGRAKGNVSNRGLHIVTHSILVLKLSPN